MKLSRGAVGVLCVGLSVLFLHHGNYWSAHWASKWAILGFAFSVGIALHVGKRFGYLTGILAGYLLLSAASVGMWPQNTYVGKVEVIEMLALEKNSLYAFIVLSMAAMLSAGWKKPYERAATLFFGVVWGASVLRTLLPMGVSPSVDGGFSGNPSMNGCLIVATMPFLFANSVLTCLGAWLATALAVYMTKASIPLGVFALTTVVYVWREYRPSIRWAGTLLGGGFLMVLAGHFYLGSDLFENTGRFQMWRLALAWWSTHAEPLFGTGMGTAQVIIPIVQATTDIKTTEYFLWLHNDWLQILFEGGVIGLALAVGVYLLTLKKAWYDPVVFASLTAFGAMAFFNYPLRLPIHALCWLLVSCLALG